MSIWLTTNGGKILGVPRESVQLACQVKDSSLEGIAISSQQPFIIVPFHLDPMSQSMKRRALTYGDAVRALNTEDMQNALDEACRHLAVTIINLMESAVNIDRLLHTVDLQLHTSSFRPLWSCLQKVRMVPGLHERCARYY